MLGAYRRCEGSSLSTGRQDLPLPYCLNQLWPLSACSIDRGAYRVDLEFVSRVGSEQLGQIGNVGCNAVEPADVGTRLPSMRVTTGKDRRGLYLRTQVYEAINTYIPAYLCTKELALTALLGLQANFPEPLL